MPPKVEPLPPYQVVVVVVVVLVVVVIVVVLVAVAPCANHIPSSSAGLIVPEAANNQLPLCKLNLEPKEGA